MILLTRRKGLRGESVEQPRRQQFEKAVQYQGQQHKIVHYSPHGKNEVERRNRIKTENHADRQ